VTLHGGDKRFHQHLAEVLEANGKLKRALLYYENLLKFDPQDTYAQTRSASIRMQLEQANHE